MASPISASVQSSYLRCPFLGDATKVRVPGVSAPRVAVVRKIVECKESRIGKQPIPVPANVTLTMDGQYLKAKGPLGELDLTYPREIKLDKEESGVLRVRKTVETRRANQMHGLFRHFSLFSPLADVLISHFSAILYMVTYYARYNVLLMLSRESRSLCNVIGINSVRITSLVSSYIIGVRTLTDNIVVGVSKGFEKKLQLIGTGYRATVEGKDIVLNLGFSHPVRMEIPTGLQVKVEENTRITVSGYDKSEIGQFAASIRKWRPPEPYKGKGVKYADEVVRRKEGKAGKKK